MLVYYELVLLSIQVDINFGIVSCLYLRCCSIRIWRNGVGM